MRSYALFQCHLLGNREKSKLFYVLTYFNQMGVSSKISLKKEKKIIRLVPIPEDGSNHDISISRDSLKNKIVSKHTNEPYILKQASSRNRDKSIISKLVDASIQKTKIENELAIKARPSASYNNIYSSQLKFPTYEEENMPSIDAILKPLTYDISKSKEKNSIFHSYEPGDMVEIIFQKTRHILGIVLSCNEENNTLLLLLWSNKMVLSDNSLSFTIKSVMPFVVRFRAKNWLYSASGLPKEIIEEILSIPKEAIENFNLSPSGIFQVPLLLALKKFESTSLVELGKLLKLFPMFENKFIQVQPNSSSNAWSPQRFLLECTKLMINDNNISNSFPFSVEKLHAAYRLLFYNSRNFIKPPFLGPSGPYFMRSSDDLIKLDRVLAISQSSIETFRQKLLGHIENWRRSLKSLPTSSSPDQSISSIQIPNLGYSVPDTLEFAHNNYYTKVKDIFATESDQLLLWALQKYSCLHQYNILGTKGHPLSSVISQLLSGIIEVDCSPGSLYPVLEKTGLLPPDHNIHWDQSCLEYEPPKDVIDMAQDLLQSYYINDLTSSNIKKANIFNDSHIESDRNDPSSETNNCNFAVEKANLFPKKKQLPDGSFLGDRIEFCQLALAIDSADTVEIDDAISVNLDDPNSPYWSVHVHVADPTVWIPRNSLLQEYCAQRTSSIYVPEAKVSMLPPSLLDTISLGGQTNNSTLSLGLTFSFQVEKATGEIFLGHILNPKEFIRPSIVKNVQRLTYEEADTLIESDDPTCSKSTTLSLLVQVSRALSLKRASITPHKLLKYIQCKPSPEVKLDGPKENPGSIIRIVDGNDLTSVSRIIVSELMVAAGVVAAIISQHLRIPVPFRVQEPPYAEHLETASKRIDDTLSKRDLSSQLLNIVGGHLVLSSGLLAPSMVSLVAGTHWSMGLAAYVRATSPMRRYADMLTHYQIKSAMFNNFSIFSEQDLVNNMDHVNELEPQLKSLQRRATRFWILTFVLRQPATKIWDAVVLNSTKASSPTPSTICQIYILELFSSFSLYLDACMLDTVKGFSKEADFLAPGTRIQVTAGSIKRDLNQATWYIAGINQP